MTAGEEPAYAYRCVDRSILLPFYKPRCVRPVALRLPDRLPANLVTISASLFMWAALALAAGALALPPAALALAFVVLLQVHEVYDHADGMHAKRTGSTSALGEYLDHALDAYHGPIIVVAFFALAGFEHRTLVLFSLWTLQLAFVATMAEEKELGELRLGPIGSLEGVMGFCVVFLTWLVPPVRAWWLAPLADGVPAYALLVVAGAAGMAATVWACVRRMGRLPAQVALFGAGGLTLAVLLSRAPLPTWAAVACMLMYGGDHAGRVIGSHLLRRPHPWPDLVAPLVAALLVALPHAPAWAAAALPLYLALRAVLDAGGVLAPLRFQWRWANPAAAPT